ncbi:MAG TPA: SDR family oxidoreductase [Bryobacteraceae bacterium]|nr:SDR family oxidoreductase [Bryobacteraceae bacterium]
MSKGTALVTGASGGIGAELAKLCAAGGHDVILVARSTAKLEALAQSLSQDHGIAARPLSADLADPKAPKAIFEQTRGDRVELLINNAGFGWLGAYSQIDWSVETRMAQVNMVALAELTRLYLPEMLQRKSGRILNVASTAAFVPGPFMAMYYATKAFVVSLSLAIANEVKGSGVTVTVLCPGPTATGFSEAAGTAGSKLFEGAAMSAQEVARDGYRAMMAGQPEVISGTRNRLMMLGTRLAPRTMLAGIARRLNSKA